MTTQREAYVTLCCNDAYVPGALAWAQSVRDSGSVRDIVIMITKGISPEWLEELQVVANHIEVVDIYDSGDVANLAILQRPELGITFTKFHCWRLIQYTKAVFMDADTLILQNIDDLFEREELSASPDPGWPDCFNSGVFVFQPSLETHEKLMQFALTERSFDGGDQGLLNMYFSNWLEESGRRLPFVYNCCTQKFYSYQPALAHFRSQVRVVHFIGATKPWQIHGELYSAPKGSETSDFLHLWWNTYSKKVHPRLSEKAQVSAFAPNVHYYHSIATTSGSSDPLQQQHHHHQHSESGKYLEDRDRQYAWERGDIDYTGSDRFSNIMAKLTENLEAATLDQQSTEQATISTVSLKVKEENSTTPK